MDPAGKPAPAGGFQTGGWYSGYQYWNGSFAPQAGQIHPQSNQQGAGQQVSQEVVAQTNPANVGYIQAQQLQSPVSVPLTNQAGVTAELEAARKALEQNLASQQTQNQAQLEAARAKEEATLKEAEPLTRPFREDLEKAERERLGTDVVLSEQRELLNELDQILSEGNELIRQQKEVTGLAAVRNPRIAQTMSDVMARAGVIEAVVSLQNTYLANAYQSIDRSIRNITEDRQDRLSYYNTILKLADRDILLLDAESKRIAQEQTNLLKFDLEHAQQTVDEVKRLMMNPDTALLMAQAGVTLNDSVATISQKMSQAVIARDTREMANAITSKGGVLVADPSTVPANQLASFTAPNGQTYHYKMPAGTGSTAKVGSVEYVELLKYDAREGVGLMDIFAIYSGLLTADQIYQLYNATSIHGPAYEDIGSLAKYGVTQPKSSDRTP